MRKMDIGNPGDTLFDRIQHDMDMTSRRLKDLGEGLESLEAQVGKVGLEENRAKRTYLFSSRKLCFYRIEWEQI